MKKSISFLWRTLVAVVIVISLVSAISIQATLSAPTTVSAAPPAGCPRTPTTPSPANLSTTNVFTGLSWAITTNATRWDVYWDNDGDGIPGDDIMVSNQISTNSTSFSDLMTALSLDALDSCETYYWQVVAWNTSSGNPNACSNTSKIFQFNTGPMIGAVTGWTWEFPHATVGGPYNDDPTPYNTNTRDSIMVVFDDNCFNDYLNTSFRVTYTYSANGRLSTMVNETPKAAVIHYWNENDYENCGSSDDYALVFLTLSKPMATNATPTVRLMNGTTQVQSLTADDGIAPIIELSYTGSPYAGGDITVTATATEPLEDAYIVTSSDDSNYLPTSNFFPAEVQEPDEYGGYCYDGNNFDWFGYTDMSEMDTYGSVASYTFNMEAQNPNDTFFVEVYAHDNTWCDDGWDDSACKWWRHEKWSSSSQTIEGYETIVLHLVEGWNLISFPRTPADPTLRGVFGDNIVNKVYTFKSDRWYGAKYDSASGTWMTPAGVGPLTTINIEPGVGYWVYCSNAGVDQDFYEYYLSELASYYGMGCDTNVEVSWTDLIVELQPAAVGPVTPPSYALTQGWNLVGVPVQGSLDAYQLKWGGQSEIHHAPVTLVSDFLTSVKDKWKALYWYLPTFTVWSDCGPGPSPTPGYYGNSVTFPSGYQIATPDTTQSPAWKLAYWMSAFGGMSYIPQEVPAWVLGTNVGFTKAVEGGGTYYNCDEDYLEFGFNSEGYTDANEYIWGSFDGSTDGSSDIVSGEFDGYIDRGPMQEDFYATFSGTLNWLPDDYTDAEFSITGTFTGTTEMGRTITGTLNIQGYYDGGDVCYDNYYIDGGIDGTITSTGIFSNMAIDDAMMKDIAPVVMPGFGYWVWMDSVGTLIPSVATATGGTYYYYEEP